MCSLIQATPYTSFVISVAVIIIILITVAFIRARYLLDISSDQYIGLTPAQTHKHNHLQGEGGDYRPCRKVEANAYTQAHIATHSLSSDKHSEAGVSTHTECHLCLGTERSKGKVTCLYREDRLALVSR